MSAVRDRILEVAGELFYSEGVRAVGVDTIIAQADVARMSFYRHFKSKDGLVLACVQQRDERVLTWFEREVARLAPEPRDRPLAVFDALAIRFKTERYRGCGLLNTMSEMPDRTDTAHRAAAQHKTRFEGYLAGLLRDAGHSEAHAADLMQLFDGAAITAVRLGTPEPAMRARRMAALLLGLPAVPTHPGPAATPRRRTRRPARAR
ncbi:MAG: TetR/AcrR family transcriptional regulator [Planctomycetota bacterium]